MPNQNNFNLPVLIIKEVKPLLSKNDMVFAYKLKAITESDDIFNIYENNGLELSNCIGERMECLLEITKGEFRYEDEEDENNNDNKNPKPQAFNYLWLKRPYEFFSELVAVRNNTDKSSFAEESRDQLFESTATKFFEEWGLNGLHLGVYQAKPVLSNSNGIFLLNEYEFQEDIERLELGEKVFIIIDELYLRGIRHLKSSKNTTQKQIFPQSRQKAEPPQQIPKEEIPEKKKGRFDSLLD